MHILQMYWQRQI